jgi:TRAP-type C4-dicarboxylate transport system permease small subunit
MPPLTAPDKPLSPLCWRFLLVVACVLVFAFALHAKVAVYHQSPQPQTATSAKLWLNGEKAGLPLPSGLPVLWFAAMAVILLCRQGQSRYEAVSRTLVPAQASQHYLHRFLRPPPVR